MLHLSISPSLPSPSFLLRNIKAVFIQKRGGDDKIVHSIYSGFEKNAAGNPNIGLKDGSVILNILYDSMDIYRSIDRFQIRYSIRHRF